MSLFVKPCQLRVIGCFPHYGLFPHLHLFLRPLAPLASRVIHPTFPQVVHPIFFTFPGRRSVRIFPGLQFNFFRRGLQTCSYISQCVSTSGLWRMGLFLILPLLLWQNIFLLSRKMVLWIRSETHDILSSDIRLLIFVIINLVPTAKPKTSQFHNIDLHQSTESTGTQIYFSSRFSMLSMLEPF